MVDELVAADFFDHLHYRRGPEELKRTIVGLRQTFPDLSLSVEEQRAEADKDRDRFSYGGPARATRVSLWIAEAKRQPRRPGCLPGRRARLRLFLLSSLVGQQVYLDVLDAVLPPLALGKIQALQ